jgi:copper chaperone CopZ
MKKLLLKFTLAIMLTTNITACDTQIKNAKTEIIKIYGNCVKCESIIEKAGNEKKIAKVDWNKDTKMASITFDDTKTNIDEILKKIALSGYDNEKYLAPNDVYAKLRECCQYERKEQQVAYIETIKKDSTIIEKNQENSVAEPILETPQLKNIFENYFALKDALVNTNTNAASEKAKEMVANIKAIKMEKLTMQEHDVWMKVMNEITTDAAHIVDLKDISKQRNYFITLSKNIYALIKVSKQETPTYFQHCPMANNGKGANWLSKENEIKNPYYGSQMMSCGKTIETIK